MSLKKYYVIRKDLKHHLKISIFKTSYKIYFTIPSKLRTKIFTYNLKTNRSNKTIKNVF
jgi:hypothetical protein